MSSFIEDCLVEIHFRTPLLAELQLASKWWVADTSTDYAVGQRLALSANAKLRMELAEQCPEEWRRRSYDAYRS